MFRLEDRQLHILIGLLSVASILLFCVFGLNKVPQMRQSGGTIGMEDFSEAWVCTYETDDEVKLLESQNAEGNTMIEVVNFPAAFPVKQGETVTLTHKLPAMDTDTIYLFFKTDNQAVRVSVDQNILYVSEEADKLLPAFHVVPVASQYKDMVVSIGLTGQQGDEIAIGKIQTGTYDEVLTQAFLENGLYFILGVFLFLVGACLLLVWILIKKTSRQKKILLYGSLEGLSLGILFLSESQLWQVIVNWNYGMYFLKACVIVIAAVLHLMMIRCFMYKKRVLFLTDIGIAIFGIFYITVMVLQAFSLIQFDGIYLAGKILYVFAILVYTIVLSVAIYNYGRKEGKPVFFANGFLMLCIALKTVMYFIGSQNGLINWYIPVGFLLYLIIVWVSGLKQALYIAPVKEDTFDENNAITRQVVEQLNPNLLFASFHTLQNLIKSGSAMSVKMIYYISVYVRNNLKALEQRGEVIPFEEELEHMIAYLQLQKTRNQKFEFSIECKVKEFRVPRHSIEPMVENAVKYGIAGHDNRGNVVVRVYQREDGYAIQVIDDGVGFDKKMLSRKSPTALLSLFDLLEKKCSAKTEIISKMEKGTVITIILPMLENDLME